MNQKLAFVLFAFSFIVVLVVGVGVGGKEDLRPAPAEFRAKFQDTLLRPREKPAVTPVVPERAPAGKQSDRRPAGRAESVEGEALARDAFARKYGERLVFTEFEGRVIRIDGSGLPSEAFEPGQKVDGFRTSDAAAVSARAREIFANARKMLGVPDDAEFILNPPTTGESTAQVVAQQSQNGVPISPGGLVTMLIGPEGGIRALDSSIYPKTEIANVVRLAPPPQSREILFVTQSAPTAVLRHAYETRDRGIQTVTDAETGEVLLERNRRIH